MLDVLAAYRKITELKQVLIYSVFSIKSTLLLKSFKYIPGLCITKMHTAKILNQ
jgi:hypothetical protein